MSICYFDERRNTIYINSDYILPKTKGMPWKEHCKAIEDAFKMSYEERLERFCPESYREEVKREISNHKGCKICEYSNIY